MNTQILNKRRPAQGFTLVEVLVVLTLIAMLLFLTVPGLKDVFSGSKLTTTADNFVSDMGLARQTAVKENVPVEFRFYKFRDPSNPAEERFGAYQCFRLRQDLNTPSSYATERIAVPIFERIKFIPAGVVMVNSQKWATVLTDNKLTKGFETVRGLIPGEKETEAQYVSFIITPEGETNLDKSGAKTWFLTLVNEKEILKAANPEAMTPSNFIMLQLDPFTANVRRYQPN